MLPVRTTPAVLPTVLECKYFIRINLNPFFNVKETDNNYHLEIRGINNSLEEPTEMPFRVMQQLSNVLKSKCYCNNNQVSFELAIESNYFIDIEEYLEEYFEDDDVNKEKELTLKDKDINEIFGKYNRITSNTCEEIKNDKCSICLEEYKTKEGYRIVECCNSVFHKKCIDKWCKSQHLNCPLCRHRFAAEPFGAAAVPFGDRANSI